MMIDQERSGIISSFSQQISVGMRSVFQKLSETIWKKLFASSCQTFEQHFSSWEKSCIEIEKNKKPIPLLTLKRAEKICKYLSLQLTEDNNSKTSNHILIIYTWQVWQITDLISKLFPPLNKYCQTNFLKLQRLSPSLFHSDISVKQFLLFTDNYFPTDICEIILDYDVLRPESSDVFWKRQTNLLKKRLTKTN
jgi:hypothetical protein